MSSERLKASLSIKDLTDPANGLHAINIIVNRIKQALVDSHSGVPVEEVRINPTISVKKNFDDLLFPADNLSRSSCYTRYVSSDTVLRTHTSSAVPGWLKTIADESLIDKIAIFPGICFRRDVVDKTHCGEPHQMDVWRVRQGEPLLKRKNLVELIEVILNSVVPGYAYRMNEVKHPYTINGLEVEVLVDNNWLEILECGEAHPIVLKNAGLNPDSYTGLALGMGLDRLVMIIKEIGDIRILRSNDPRIMRQMANLDKFIIISDQPATKRVLSYSTSKDKIEEDVCEEIRDELGENVIYLEEVEYQEIAYESLPQKARENLGIRPEQKNIVVTLIFRSLEGSLQRTLVNQWVQQLYPKLNEGDRGYI